MKTTVINSPLALKASRGTLSIWMKGNSFGAGTEPKANKKSWPAHLLADTAADLLQQGYSLSITQHDD